MESVDVGAVSGAEPGSIQHLPSDDGAFLECIAQLSGTGDELRVVQEDEARVDGVNRVLIKKELPALQPLGSRLPPADSPLPRQTRRELQLHCGIDPALVPIAVVERDQLRVGAELPEIQQVPVQLVIARYLQGRRLLIFPLAPSRFGSPPAPRSCRSTAG